MRLNEISLPYSLSTTLQLTTGSKIILRGDNGVGKSLLLNGIKWWRFQHQMERWSFVDQFPLRGFDQARVKDYFGLLMDVASSEFVSTSVNDWAGFKETQFEKHLNKFLVDLSGGENQWLKLLIGFNQKTKGLIMDEPLQFLDSQKRNLFWSLLEEWLSSERTCLMVLHQSETIPGFLDWKLSMKEQKNRILECE
jgi:ABC-type Mn2+/Zn2+ transport system ATPase subunit